MFDNDRYPYAQGPLLEQPNTYFYTAYHGQSFIDAWQQSRILSSPPQTISRPSAGIERCEAGSNQIDTKCLLQDLLARQADYNYWWPRLVKKFEVKKRLFAAYHSDAPHRPIIDSGYQDLDIYLLFAEWLVLSYQQQGNLQLLNTLLKVMDTLISLQKMLSSRQVSNLAWLLDQEKDCVSHLQQAIK